MAAKKLTTSEQVANLLATKDLGLVVTTGQLPHNLTDYGTSRWYEMAREASQATIDKDAKLDYFLAGAPSALTIRLTKAIEAGKNAARFAAPKGTFRRIE